MASTTALLNRALGLIGAKRLISLDDISASGQLVRDTYDDIRQGLLQAHNWPFATFLEQLAQEAAPPAYGLSYSFRKPQATAERGALLRTLGIFTEPTLQRWALGYVDAGPILFADQTPLYFQGLFDIVDPNKMAPLFREALTYKCASEWAVPLSNSRSAQQTYTAQHEAVLLRARALADMEGPPMPMVPSTWEMARFGMGGIGIAGLFADPTKPSSG